MPRAINDILVLDPNANTATTIPSTIVGGTFKWFGAVLARNGKIYGIPQDENNIVVIDPKANGNFCDSILLSGYMNKL